MYACVSIRTIRCATLALPLRWCLNFGLRERNLMLDSKSIIQYYCRDCGSLDSMMERPSILIAGFISSSQGLKYNGFWVIQIWHRIQRLNFLHCSLGILYQTHTCKLVRVFSFFTHHKSKSFDCMLLQFQT